MAQLSGLSIEYRSGLLLGLLALVLSVLTGLISGIGFVVILIRALIMVPVFVAVGYGTIIILKKYVPEIYDVLVNVKKDEGPDQGQENYLAIQDLDSESSEFSGDINAETSDEGYAEQKGDNFSRLDTINDSGLDDELGGNTADPETGKMGKHVVVDESKFEGYEPSLMAEAVRTMMSKDKE